MSTIRREPVRLNADEAAALRRAVVAQRPEFGPRMTAGQLTTELIVQPWFRRHRVIEVMSQAQFPALQIHVAFGEDGQCGVLTGNLPVFSAMVTTDPPPRLATTKDAMIYANAADYWTTTSDLGELLLTSLDDVPWFPDLGEVEQMLIDDLDEMIGAAMAAPTVTEVDGGFSVVKWVLTASQLFRRELTIDYGGRVTRTDELLDSELPVPMGRMWGMVDGRLVPTG